SAPAVDRYNPDVCIRYDVLFTAQRPSALSLFPYTTLFRSDEPVDVAVGGLGLGYTARAVLEHARVHSLVVIEALGELIDWHEQRSEEHTSELQSRFDLVCRLLLENKNKIDLD